MGECSTDKPWFELCTSYVFARKYLWWKCLHFCKFTDRTFCYVNSTFKWANVCSSSRVPGWKWTDCQWSSATCDKWTDCQWSSCATWNNFGSCCVADDATTDASDTDDDGLHEQVSSWHCATNARYASACNWWRAKFFFEQWTF